MIPNGTQIGCIACHTSQFGGGARNAFGQDVFAIVRGPSATAFWSATLAAKDSDGDGFTNGEELGDPDGDGVPTPGAVVTNPGNRNSRPPDNVAPTAAVSEPAEGAQLIAGIPVTLKATASDSDGTVARVEFFNGEVSLGSVSAAPFEITTTFAAGSHTLTVRATDNRGATTTSAPIRVTAIDATPIQITSIVWTGDQITIRWTGGVGPFRLVASTTMAPGSWAGDGSISERTATIRAEQNWSFFRVQDLGP